LGPVSRTAFRARGPVAATGSRRSVGPALVRRSRRPPRVNLRLHV
jgi:hypothetical protein